MTPRERMRAFLAGKRVDRIPNGLGGCETAGLHNLAYDRLKRVLGVDEARNRVMTFMFNSVFEPSLLEAMDGDCILLASRMCPSRLWGPNADTEWKAHQLWDLDLQVSNAWSFRRDGDGTVWWNDSWKCPPGALYFDPPASSEIGMHFSDADQPSPADFHPSHELPEEQLQRLEDDARWLHENTDYSIVCGEMISDLQLQPGGSQAWWIRMVEDPDGCHEFLDKAVDASLAQLEQLDQAVGKYCDMLDIAHDMGDNRGVTIGPDLWRSIYKPHYKRLFAEWRRITNMKINLHTCGSVVDILDDLIECGVQVYNPVQISASGMAPDEIKNRFGSRITFYGGVFDSQRLPPPTLDDVVYKEVKRNIETLSAGGGYIFAGVHNLPGDIPEGHLAAIMRAYRDCRDNPALTGAQTM